MSGSDDSSGASHVPGGASYCGDSTAGNPRPSGRRASPDAQPRDLHTGAAGRRRRPDPAAAGESPSNSPLFSAIICLDKQEKWAGRSPFFFGATLLHGDEPGRTAGTDVAPDGVRTGRLGEVSQGPVRPRLHRQAQGRERRGLRAREPPADAAVRGRERRFRPAGGVVAGTGPAAAQGGGFPAVRGRGGRIPAARTRSRTRGA